MQMRYRDIVGKEVRRADGRRLGRVATLIAEPCAGSLYVTALVVGPAGILGRMGLGMGDTRHVPWKYVERIDRSVHLTPDMDSRPATEDEQQ